MSRPDEEELVDYDEAYEESFVPSVNGPGQSTKGQLEAEFAAKVAIPGEDDELLGIAAPDGMVWSEEEEKFVRIEEELVDYDETPLQTIPSGAAMPSNSSVRDRASCYTARRYWRWLYRSEGGGRRRLPIGRGGWS